MIERAGVQPHAPGIQRPRISHGARQQMLPEAAPEFRGDDAEVSDLDGIILCHAPQLVPAGEMVLRAPAPPLVRDEELNGWIREMLRDLLVGPVPAVEPVKRLADRAIARAVEVR